MADNQRAFDELAESWYRAHHWTRFERDLEPLATQWSGGRLLNVGCGHGADFIPFHERFSLCGLDFSAAMLIQARRFAARHHFEADLVLADARQLPFADSSFDWSIAVASYHHLESRGERLQALGELRRVLKPGGESFITVWNRWQVRFWTGGKDRLVPWKLKTGVIARYYHLYSHGELRKDLLDSGFQVIRIGPEAAYKGLVHRLSRNITALVRKKTL